MNAFFLFVHNDMTMQFLDDITILIMTMSNALMTRMSTSGYYIYKNEPSFMNIFKPWLGMRVPSVQYFVRTLSHCLVVTCG